jgi:hypothetical protein
MTFKELDVVCAFSSVLHRKESGTIVCAYDKPDEAYEVEFTDTVGQTLSLEVFRPEEMELVWSNGEEGFRCTHGIRSLDRIGLMQNAASADHGSLGYTH